MVSFQISSEVKNTFLQIYNAVKERETQLLRQIEVLAQHCKVNNSYEKCFKQISVVFDNELDVLLSISKFGRINFNGLSYESNFLKIEEYQNPDKDHVSLFKCVSKDNKETLSNKVNETKTTSIDVESNVEPVTKHDEKAQLEEKKEYTAPNVILPCIEKQDPSLCLYEIEEKKKNESCILPEKFASCCSSPNQCDNPNIFKDTSPSIVNSSSEPNLSCSCNVDRTSVQKDSSEKESSSANSAEELGNASDRVKKLSMKQPVQVQQWMKQIISEPEIEPGPNNVMEHSQIKVFYKDTT